MSSLDTGLPGLRMFPVSRIDLLLNTPPPVYVSELNNMELLNLIRRMISICVPCFSFFDSAHFKDYDQGSLWRKLRDMAPQFQSIKASTRVVLLLDEVLPSSRSMTLLDKNGNLHYLSYDGELSSAYIRSRVLMDEDMLRMELPTMTGDANLNWLRSIFNNLFDLVSRTERQLRIASDGLAPILELDQKWMPRL
jgi:hypothetical protein